MRNLGFKLYLLFGTSWFLHLPARVPFLGTIRFDLLLVVAMAILVLANRAETGYQPPQADKWLRALIAYSILVIPFVEWPGTVIRFGLPDLIKAAAFYYFTIAFVKTEKELKQFISVFVIWQLWRVAEPLYLHVTTGYWGDVAYEAGGEYLNRLSGAPHDVVNPNGLAFIICTVLPFIYFLSGLSWVRRLVLLGVAPLAIYALVLTGSRSGIIGLGVVFAGILMKSKRRVLLLVTAGIALVVGFPWLDPDMQDRYLSLIGMSQKHEATAKGRLEGMEQDIEVVARRPIFGHGLGTSREANFHFGGRDQPSHNIYLEVAEELGVAGLVIFMLFMIAIFRGFIRLRTRLREADAGLFLQKAVDAIQTWLAMDFIFSFASYGLLSYEWYLLGGLLAVIERQAQAMRSGAKAVDKAEPWRYTYPRR
jgi:O-antigen ligase